MGSLRSKLKHAFAVDKPGPAVPTEKQKPAVDWVCHQIAKRRLTLPGLIALEMGRPLNYIGSMAMHFVSPGVWAVAPKHIYGRYQDFAEFLESRGSTEYMSRRIEELEAEYMKQDDKRKANKKNKKNNQNKSEHYDEN